MSLSQQHQQKQEKQQLLQQVHPRPNLPPKPEPPTTINHTAMVNHVSQPQPVNQSVINMQANNLLNALHMNPSTTLNHLNNPTTVNHVHMTVGAVSDLTADNNNHLVVKDLSDYNQPTTVMQSTKTGEHKQIVINLFWIVSFCRKFDLFAYLV